MIEIGCTGWGDHHSLYAGVSVSDKLKAYSEHFPLVEVDASFYAIQPQKNYQKWVEETPDSFGFVVKAFQGMTGHDRGETPVFSNVEEMFTAFTESVQPLIVAGKLRAVLCQFPPWFDCRRTHVEKLKKFRDRLQDFRCALEFRHQSWYHPQFCDQTLEFLKEQNWVHVICDEPQAGEGSVPIVSESTNSEMTLVRLHGRNREGWIHKGPNWRAVRCLYRYSHDELAEWVQRLHKLQDQSKHVEVLFNNNSGGDAADNAYQLIHLLGIKYEGLAPKQLGFF